MAAPLPPKKKSGSHRGVSPTEDYDKNATPIGWYNIHWGWWFTLLCSGISCHIHQPSPRAQFLLAAHLIV